MHKHGHVVVFNARYQGVQLILDQLYAGNHVIVWLAKPDAAGRKRFEGIVVFDRNREVIVLHDERLGTQRFARAAIREIAVLAPEDGPMPVFG